ncbi:farnesyl-diphosphate synthase [Candidatus Electrothrix marina]|uniref:Farnesyl-diphosphate synthase n=1 Tax=Candidatus Electrothrix marina TaxID=1859130 RepID=A0A444JBE3_9BACT|nr:farnesyl-diphosphate synthase [Candidatus Electrothrix marina]
MFDIQQYLSEQRRVAENGLQRYMMQQEGNFSGHIESMRYSLFVGGKRIRPILCLAAGRSVSDVPEIEETLLPAACALECIHTYSLIHDDLPAMDNDDLRRGQPTCHKKFGEAEAILAGDGLLTYAFSLLSNPDLPGPEMETRLQLIAVLAHAAGSQGMVGGQYLDIASEEKIISFDLLKTIHRSKTGALITAAVRMGALAARADQRRLEALTRYGDAVGLAFQIVDDLLDVTASTEQLGKTAGTDAQQGKATYPAFFGKEKTRALAKEAVDSAQEALSSFDERAEPLRALAQYIFKRTC